MTVEELRAYVAALRRMKAGEGPGEEDEAILQRVEEQARIDLEQLKKAGPARS